MIKRLTKHGNSLALVIDRGVLELLDVNADIPPFADHGWQLPGGRTGSRRQAAGTVP